MGLLNTILQGFRSQRPSEEGHGSLLNVALDLIGNPQSGGLTGLLERFKSQGLGDVFSSWVSTGQNQPIHPEQVQQVLGQDKLMEIASRLGIPSGEVSQGLAKLLPEVVDKVTPEGNIPTSESLGERFAAVKKMLGG